MRKKVRLSVVIATYNGESFISAQLESILKIISDEDEIVVSDDCSTDLTPVILNSFDDQRIKLLFSTKRVGCQKNFERAIAKSSGKYIFFSDQDDICLADRVTKSLEALKTHKFVCGDAIITDENLQPIANSYFTKRKVNTFNAWRLFVKPSVIGATMACTRKFLFKFLPFPNQVPHDQWLSILASLHGELIVIRTPIILYRRHLGVASLTGLGKKEAILR